MAADAEARLRTTMLKVSGCDRLAVAYRRCEEAEREVALFQSNLRRSLDTLPVQPGASTGILGSLQPGQRPPVAQLMTSSVPGSRHPSSQAIV